MGTDFGSIKEVVGMEGGGEQLMPSTMWQDWKSQQRGQKASDEDATSLQEASDEDTASVTVVTRAYCRCKDHGMTPKTVVCMKGRLVGAKETMLVC